MNFVYIHNLIGSSRPRAIEGVISEAVRTRPQSFLHFYRTLELPSTNHFLPKYDKALRQKQRFVSGYSKSNGVPFYLLGLFLTSQTVAYLRTGHSGHALPLWIWGTLLDS